MTSIILVATYKGKTWVIEDADHDLDWEVQAQGHIAKPESRFSWDRALALLLAHNIQRKKPHDFGVWEVFLKDEKEEKKGKGDKKKDKDKAEDVSSEAPEDASSSKSTQTTQGTQTSRPNGPRNYAQAAGRGRGKGDGPPHRTNGKSQGR